MLIIKEEHLVVKKTARYYTNNPSSKITSVSFVIHGYATLAKNFIGEFDFLNTENTLIIAPEGLSKFYFRDKLAASWMTKEDRLNEINDYVNYLDEVFERIKKNFDIRSSVINIIGFSQGVHTAARWFINSRNHFDKLVLCSSDFPKDVDFENLKKKLSENSKMYFVYGKRDRIIDLKKFEESIEMLKKNEIKFEEITFDGEHTIDKNTLLKLS